jgi:hypothetical protein
MALSTLAALGLSAGSASAQYNTGLNSGFYSGYSTGNYSGFMPGLYVNNPYTGQSFNYNYTSRVFLGADYVNPYTGIRNTFYYNNVQSGALLPGMPFISPYSYPQVSGYGMPGGYLTGGVGTYGVAPNNPAFNPIVQEQVRLLRAAGGQGNNNDVEARKLIADQWAYEQRAKKLVAPVAAAGAAFQAANEDQILSGRTMNELATAIRDLEGKGAKATPSLLPADLLSHIAYSPGVPADVVELAAAGKLTFPETLAEREWMTLRADLQKAATPVLELASAGKRVPSTAAEKLAAEVKSARKEIAPLLRDVTFLEATELTRFLNRLENLSRLGTDANLNGVYVPAWTTVGAAVNEYVKHLGKYNMTVSQRSTGDDEAYFSLYRAMLDYYNALNLKK